MALFGQKKKSEEAPVKKAAKPVAEKKASAKTPAKASTKVVKPAVEKAEKVEKKTEKAEKKAPASSTVHADHGNHASVLMRPRVTEKSSLKAESENVYVFEVARNANKETIYRAVVDLYKVTPRKVAITQTPSKNVFSRGKRGVQSGVKKAYVYLNKGEKIEII